MKIDVDEGFVRLVACQATDLSVVNSARVSFGKEKSELDESDRKLISFLMRERHGTPFEHNFFQFHIKCPIFVAREWFRHRIGSFNEFSMRYAEVNEPEYFIPSKLRTQVGKPGAYHFEELPFSFNTRQWLNEVAEHCDFATYLYDKALELGIAREQARIVFPVNIYTEFHWSINARSLLNFLSLRNSPHAMKEIRDYAIALESILEQQMPITYSAFIENDRIAV